MKRNVRCHRDKWSGHDQVQSAEPACNGKFGGTPICVAVKLSHAMNLVAGRRYFSAALGLSFCVFSAV